MTLRLLLAASVIALGSACIVEQDDEPQDRDGDGFAGDEDCDDADPLTYVGATELCDELDNDCDGYIPANETNDWDGDGVGACYDCNDTNPDAAESVTYWADFDGDGYGDADTTKISCGEPAGYTTNDQDCDDDDPYSYPDQVWYLDFDEDGYGSPDIWVPSCLRPAGPWTHSNTDCDDLDPDAHPGAVWYEDVDGDGFGAPGTTVDQCDRPKGGPWAGNDDDCDDNNATVFPGQVWAPDADGDGFGDETMDEISCGSPGGGYVYNATDCNDEEKRVYPGAEEVCDGWDTDCDGKMLPEEIDGDGDGFGVCQGDEDDTDPTVFPILTTWYGVAENVVQSELVGWEECFVDNYSVYGSPMSTILSSCNKRQWLVGCRVRDSGILTIAAHAEADILLTDTGYRDYSRVTNANGTDWYYNGDWSMGFTHEGDGVNKNSCDTNSGSYPQHRMCWHMSGSALSGGYRCGSSTSLYSTSWERVIFHSD